MQWRALIRSLLLIGGTFFLLAPGLVTRSQTPEPPTTDPASLALMERLNETPLLYQMSTDTVREIYERGQRMGHRADVLAKVGDSNTASFDFLRPFGRDDGECDLGLYKSLQATIDFFAEYEFDDGENSFTRSSLAAFKSMSSTSALDPFWSPEETCEANETPVACEYRVTGASTALIMLGIMDVRYADTEFFRDNMEQIIELSADMGVIPVLSTIAVKPHLPLMDYDSAIAINGAILDLAEEHDIPVINLWRAVQALPDSGIGDDNIHLKQERGKTCTFDGTETRLGGTLRNLLTLQALDELRREIFSE